MEKTLVKMFMNMRAPGKTDKLQTLTFLQDNRDCNAAHSDMASVL